MNNKTNRYSYQFRRPLLFFFPQIKYICNSLSKQTDKKKSMKENEQKKNQFNIDGIINGNVFYFPDQ